MAIQNSQDIDNTFIGKGIVKFMKEGDTTYKDLGEVPEFEYTATVDKLDYFSNRAGIRIKARSVVRETGASLRIVMSELTADNMALYFMGEPQAGTPPLPAFSIDIFSVTEIRGAIRFVGTNDIGAKIQLDFGNVAISPSAAFNPISDEWGQLEITADVLLQDDGKYGIAYWNITDEVDPVPPGLAQQQVAA